MQLLDDPKSKDLIDKIAQAKPRHRGVLSESARKLHKSERHMQKVATGKVPYNIQNVRLLRMLANMYGDLDKQAIALTSGDTLPAA